MIKEAIIKLSKKQDLDYAEAEAVMDEIMSGQATPVQMSAYLTALALKGETIDEITASAAGMSQNIISVLITKPFIITQLPNSGSLLFHRLFPVRHTDINS